MAVASITVAADYDQWAISAATPVLLSLFLLDSSDGLQFYWLLVLL
jgi:hypothetical protein